MMFIKKRCFTLMEMLISIGLAIALFSILLGFYSYISIIGKKGREAEAIAFDKLYLQSRLSELIPQSIPYYLAEKSKKRDREITTEYNFFTSYLNGSPTLTFSFFGRSSNIPIFSGRCLGKLYLNEKKQFCFAMFPSPLRWVLGEEVPVKIEILAENVDRIQFQFFAPSQVNREEMWKDLKIKKTVETNENPLSSITQGRWVTEWQNEYRRLPPIVSVELTRGSQIIKFVYVLPWSEYMITYE